MDYEKLKTDLYCSLLMSKHILSGTQIRRMLEEKKIESLYQIYEERETLIPSMSLSDAQRDRWKEFRVSKAQDKLDEYVEYVIKKKIEAIDVLDQAYPSYLRNLPNMPPILYLRGNRDLLSSQRSRVSIVGTRRPSAYGRRVTRDFAKKIAMHDVTIVSGLARGIDGIAHESCLEVHGKTIAVMPCGLDAIYPPDHTELFGRIVQEGLLVSELLPGTQAIRQYFPARNRILSALSDCVLIVEAGEKSGTLHTASFAAAQGKDVFVVPGSIYSDTSRGNLELMKDGAQIATDPEDVLAYLAGAAFFREIEEIKDAYTMHQLKEKIKTDPEALTPEEVRSVITDLLMSQELRADELVAQSQIPFPILAKELGRMEISGLLRTESQKYLLTIHV